MQPSREITPYEELSTDSLVFMFANYVHRVIGSGAGDFEFQISREALITELERLAEWLRNRYGTAS